jgi:hypothetical protein
VLTTTLHLTGLPEHESVNVNFLLAAIDSWDGSTEYAAPDEFNVALDGRVIFSETLDHLYFFDQTYQPPVGVLLAHGSNLAFSEFSDAAYNLGLDRRLDRIPHTASELTIELFASGAGWTAAYGDESWGIDNLEILLNATAADYNGNGTVDAADYVVWRKSLGQIGSELVADGNGNRLVETGDYELWRVNFGKSAIVRPVSIGSSSVGTAAPEPSTALFVALAIVIVILRTGCGAPGPQPPPQPSRQAGLCKRY